MSWIPAFGKGIAYLLLLYALYVFLSLVWFRLLRRGGLHRLRVPGAVFLTFDDGPDPEFTPRLLEVLARHGARATFFVVGERAARYPEVLRQIADAGHEIGIHNFRHTLNFFSLPWRTARGVEEAARVVEEVTGKRPTLYRPPWGALGLLDYFLLRKRFTVVFWSLTMYDWQASRTVRWLKWRFLSRVSAGEIVLLHDSGRTFGADPDAPGRTLAALDAALTLLREAGVSFRFSTLGEGLAAAARGERILDPPRLFRHHLYFAFERLHHAVFRYTPLLGTDGLLYLERRPYSGPPLVVRGETLLSPGDPAFNLHFNNELLFSALRNEGSTLRSVVQLKRLGDQSLALLAHYIAENAPDVRGVYGLSALHRGIRAFGFHVLPSQDTLWERVSGAYMLGLLGLLHPDGMRRLREGGDVSPRWVVLSRRELDARYGVRTSAKPKREGEPEGEREGGERPHTGEARAGELSEKGGTRG
ncbi:MAG: polysaccharide deacetylase family protein [Brockia lithotrophica]|nr:polysaccharide deacetylase family protein [Brockia lithotrophica]